MTRRKIRVVGAMLEQEAGCGRFLITQRSASMSLPELWEFPGGRVQDGESDEAALQRELHERLELDVTVGELAIATQHAYPGYDIEFHVFACCMKDPAQAVSHKRAQDHRWLGLADLGSYPFPDADARTLSLLLNLEA